MSLHLLDLCHRWLPGLVDLRQGCSSFPLCQVVKLRKQPFHLTPLPYLTPATCRWVWWPLTLLLPYSSLEIKLTSSWESISLVTRECKQFLNHREATYFSLTFLSRPLLGKGPYVVTSVTLVPWLPGSHWIAWSEWEKHERSFRKERTKVALTGASQDVFGWHVRAGVEVRVWRKHLRISRPSQGSWV